MLFSTDKRSQCHERDRGHGRGNNCWEAARRNQVILEQLTNNRIWKRIIHGKTLKYQFTFTNFSPSGIIVVRRGKGMSHSDSSGCWRRRSFTFDCGFIFTPIFFNYCNLGERDSIESRLSFQERFNFEVVKWTEAGMVSSTVIWANCKDSYCWKRLLGKSNYLNMAF